MQQNFISINGLSIAYTEKNQEAAQTVFFIHGNSSSSAIWSQQFNSEWLSAYRLIAFDLPAHGMSGVSDKPATDYSVTGLSDILSKAIEQLANNRQYVIAGFSLGSCIVAEMVRNKLCFNGLIFISPCIIGGNIALADIFNTAADTSALFTDIVSDEALHTFCATAINSKNNELLNGIKEDFKKVKAPFRSALLTATANGLVSDEIALLQQQSTPMLFIFGKDDNIVKTGYLNDVQLDVWNNKIYKIEGANHFVLIDEPEAVCTIISAYLNDVLQ